MATPRVTIDELPEQLIPEDANELVVQDSGVTKRMSIATLRTLESSALTDHLTDTTNAHAASAISTISSGGSVDGPNVQAQLEQIAALVGTDDTMVEDPPGSGLYFGTDTEEVVMATLPVGGAAGQVLTKESGTDYDTEWVDPIIGGTPDAHAASHTDGGSDEITVAQVQVTGLATALNGKVDTTRTISTTAPLSGGGNLSANRTLTVASFGSSASGVVPASGGGTVNYLRADGSWFAPPGTASGGITAEDAVDAVAAALTEGTGIDLVYDDGAGTITVTVDKTEMSLTAADVGLGSVNNTADTAKPISTATQTALDAKADLVRTVNAQTGTTYTVALTDAGDLVTLSNAAAIALTVPANSTAAFAVGSTIDLAQLGAGKVTVSGAGGVTVNAASSTRAFRAQYSAATLIKLATDTWLLVGDLEA